MKQEVKERARMLRKILKIGAEQQKNDFFRLDLAQ